MSRNPSYGWGSTPGEREHLLNPVGGFAAGGFATGGVAPFWMFSSMFSAAFVATSGALSGS